MSQSSIKTKMNALIFVLSFGLLLALYVAALLYSPNTHKGSSGSRKVIGTRRTACRRHSKDW